MILRMIVAVIFNLVISPWMAIAADVRLKDLVTFDGVRGNDLVGYGLVVGLDGTGDGLRNAPFTEDILANILERLGVNITGEQMRPRNVAAVIVTATLPPFARAGAQVDVTVSAIGDSTSLFGGTLVMTPLTGADGRTYAVAQGRIVAGGVAVTGQAAREARGVPTSGTIPQGARVEREVDFALGSLDLIRLSLRDPDFSTAALIEGAINREIGRDVARMLDPTTVELSVARSGQRSAAHLLGRIENLRVSPQMRARVVMDQRTGTIIIGQDVRISSIAIAKAGLALRVEEAPMVVQPNPFAAGEVVVVPRSAVGIDDLPQTDLATFTRGTSLSEIVEGLTALGIGPRDIIDIFSSIHAAGALHADLVIQ
jgi:flagellar P-ring protein precursor FlgI